LNAPMMIKAIQYSSQAENLSDFTETVKEAAIRGIFAITSAPEDLVCKENG
ncbi:PTS sugar transporter subunit IIA, partial [Neisseria sp. P0001.S004]